MKTVTFQEVKTKIPKEMMDQYFRSRCEWSAQGSPGDFYEWLLEKIERRLKESA